MTMPRPAGPEWWCNTCDALKLATIVPQDTPTSLTDIVTCPTCGALLGTVSIDVVPPPLAQPPAPRIV